MLDRSPRYPFYPEVVMGGRSDRARAPSSRSANEPDPRRGVIRVLPETHRRLKAAASAQGKRLYDFVDYLVLENDVVRKEV